MARNKKAPDNIVIEDARLVFRNFQGKEGVYNNEGKRNFCVLLDPDDAQDLLDKGWNVKFLKPRDEEEEPAPYLQVSVNFDVRPPKILLITSKGKTTLDEDTVILLDWADIETADVSIRPYVWEVNGSSGVKAYCKTLAVKIVEDAVELKYDDVPDSAASAISMSADFED